jgi:hypothetical protein
VDPSITTDITVIKNVSQGSTGVCGPLKQSGSYIYHYKTRQYTYTFLVLFRITDVKCVAAMIVPLTPVRAALCNGDLSSAVRQLWTTQVPQKPPDTKHGVSRDCCVMLYI